MDPATVAAAASFGSGLLQYAGQRDANQQSGKLALLNMKFQQKMSSTAYQRATKDMMNAGLNPALMYGRGGPASTASGSGGSFSSTTEAGVSSAMQALMVRKNLELLDKQIEKTSAEGRSAQAQSQMAWLDERMKSAQYGFYFTPEGHPKGALAELLRSEHVQKLATSAEGVSRAEMGRLSIAEQKAVSELFSQVGSGGKAGQLLMPLLLSILRR